MARLYGPHCEALWRTALCLDGYVDLFESFAHELASFYRLPGGALEAKDRMVDTWNKRRQLMQEASSLGFPEWRLDRLLPATGFRNLGVDALAFPAAELLGTA